VLAFGSPMLPLLEFMRVNQYEGIGTRPLRCLLTTSIKPVKGIWNIA